MTTNCPYCGWPDTDTFAALSRHRTPEGLTEWRRCSCGSLQVHVTVGDRTSVVTRSRPAAA